VIEPAGYYHAKAKAPISLGQALCDRFGGEVPDTLEELVTLPGVGRKTANVVLGEAFGKPGVVVDTHVARLARRFGLTAQVDPERSSATSPRCCPGKSGPRLPAGSSGMVVVSVTPAGRRAACGVARWCPSFDAGPTHEATARKLVKTEPFS
jgi:endonuclease-3